MQASLPNHPRLLSWGWEKPQRQGPVSPSTGSSSVPRAGSCSAGPTRAPLCPALASRPQRSESSQPQPAPCPPGPCSEDKAELILSGRVRLVSRAGWIWGDETNASGQPGSRVLSVKHAGHLSGRQHAPQDDHADCRPSCLEKADVRA